MSFLYPLWFDYFLQTTACNLLAAGTVINHGHLGHWFRWAWPSEWINDILSELGLSSQDWGFAGRRTLFLSVGMTRLVLVPPPFPCVACAHLPLPTCCDEASQLSQTPAQKDPRYTWVRFRWCSYINCLSFCRAKTVLLENISYRKKMLEKFRV